MNGMDTDLDAAPSEPRGRTPSCALTVDNDRRVAIMTGPPYPSPKDATMTMTLPQNEPLSVVAARIQKALSGSACEPLAVSESVVRLAQNWPAYREEAGGLSASGWLTKTFGLGRKLRWFQDRADAVEALGEASRRTWHHEAAVWAAQNVTDEFSRRRLVDSVNKYRIDKNNRNPLSEEQVVRLAKEIGVWNSRGVGKACAACATKDKAMAAMVKALTDAGLPVPE